MQLDIHRFRLTFFVSLGCLLVFSGLSLGESITSDTLVQKRIASPDLTGKSTAILSGCKYSNSSLWSLADSPIKDTSERFDVADTYLRPLAKNKHASRMAGGLVGLALGTGLIFQGANLLGEADQYQNNKAAGAIFLGGGAMVGILAIHELATPSRPEKKYFTIREIENRQLRDVEAADALQELADDARKSRLTGAAAWGALGVLQVTLLKSRDDRTGEVSGVTYYMAGLDFVAAAFCVMVRSSEENANNRYLKDTYGSPSFALAPYFGKESVGLAATLSF